MTGPVAERVQRYALEGDDADLRRLLTIAGALAEPARAALRRTGIGDGWRAVDCGCGPLGALDVLSDLVGPTGRVVGVDFSADAASRARTVATTLDLANVTVVAGDVHDLDPEELGAPLDVAFMRCFLMHQPDPVRTLTTVAGWLRPGGWLVAQEPLRSPLPRSHPPLAAVPRSFDLVVEVTERLGAPSGAVARLPAAAAAAGLEVVDVNGFFRALTFGFELHAAALAAVRRRAVETGVADEAEVDELVATLRAAQERDYDWVSSPFFLEFILRRPLVA